ncbi:gamma-glutamylcyclotransferase [Frigidibacter sp. RF13]|uniref:gamma-glutamylcyclotransferase family protein n=1 Tax=Frigidibacter sp. RF13 TaxID=2997340 RepID=UPI00226EC4B9|nr:gamma-glutamylcyclotransferase family protein [Frigidibacter sp. RF13]MCY1127704.1 gamma-glutamylcyclotransferase [Frigidibacter sp. RF13]
MDQDRLPAFFGYGSLVNRATHDHVPGEPARLEGWRRVWRQTRLRPYAFLSDEPAADWAIDGLIAGVGAGDWAALDLREAAYRRHTLPDDSLMPTPGWVERVEIYAVDPAHADHEAAHPVLLSYLDAVVQGFDREFGPEGVARFFATTVGWTSLIDDRAQPLYPRHQRLALRERKLVDDHADAMGLKRCRL